jgi:hypothetical protein
MNIVGGPPANFGFTMNEEDTKAAFGLTCSQQGPRVFVIGCGGTIYVLFVKGIARLDPATFNLTLLAESPVPV